MNKGKMSPYMTNVLDLSVITSNIVSLTNRISYLDAIIKGAEDGLVRFNTERFYGGTPKLSACLLAPKEVADSEVFPRLRMCDGKVSIQDENDSNSVRCEEEVCESEDGSLEIPFDIELPNEDFWVAVKSYRNRLNLQLEEFHKQLKELIK